MRQSSPSAIQVDMDYPPGQNFTTLPGAFFVLPSERRRSVILTLAPSEIDPFVLEGTVPFMLLLSRELRTFGPAVRVGVRVVGRSAIAPSDVAAT
jgi:hypothetical protein